MDNDTINAVEDLTRMGLERDAAVMLVIQSDEPAEHAAQEIAHIEKLCQQHNVAEVFSTTDAGEAEAIIAARRMAIPDLEHKGTLLLEDVGVPLPRLGDLVRGVDEISQIREVPIAVIAHAGDGNTHPSLVFDPMDGQQQQHGVGRLKRPWLVDSVGEDALELNHRINKALDSHNILNPGAVYSLTALSD